MAEIETDLCSNPEAAKINIIRDLTLPEIRIGVIEEE